jgi:hypothetical protein
MEAADIFTKSLSQSLYIFFRSKLRVQVNPTLSLQGSVKDARILYPDHMILWIVGNILGDILH